MTKQLLHVELIGGVRPLIYQRTAIDITLRRKRQYMQLFSTTGNCNNHKSKICFIVSRTAPNVKVDFFPPLNPMWSRLRFLPVQREVFLTPLLVLRAPAAGLPVLHIYMPSE